MEVPLHSEGAWPAMPDRTLCGDRQIHLALVAEFTPKQAEEIKTRGWWIIFGLAEAGRMLGADVMYYSSKKGEVIDMHTGHTPDLVRDACQDWKLDGAEMVETGGGLHRATVRVTRKLKTSDETADRFFEYDRSWPWLPTKVILLNGVGEYDPEVHRETSSPTLTAAALRFHANPCKYDPLSELKANPAIQKVVLQAKNQRIIKMKTDNAAEYTRLCLDVGQVPELPPDQPVHIVAIDAHIEPVESHHYIHHFGFKGSTKKCSPDINSMELEDLFFWTHGVEALLMPNEAGIRVGHGHYQSFVLEYHYEVESDDPPKYDSSGVDIFTTTVLRPNDVGVLQLGDGKLGTFSMPLGEGTNTFTYLCPPKCSLDKFTVPKLHVFRRALHMHAFGVQMRTTQYALNGTIKRTDAIEYFDFHATSAAEVRAIGTGFDIEQGDYFGVDCTYHVKPGSSEMPSMGFTSSSEMCIDFVFYYPKQPFQICGATMPMAKLLSLTPLGKLTKVMERVNNIQKLQKIKHGGAKMCYGRFIGNKQLTKEADMRHTFGPSLASSAETCPEPS